MKTELVFSALAKRYEDFNYIATEIGERILSRLEYIAVNPKNILDVGCASGYFSRKLSVQFPKAKILGVDSSEKMIAEARKQKKWLSKQSYEVMNFEDSSSFEKKYDFIFCNLMLPWIKDVNVIFDHWKKYLKPDGLLLFTTFGPDTFKELKSEILKEEPTIEMLNFIDMHDVGDALLKNNFSDPVMDTEIINWVYNDQNVMIEELKSTGMLQLLLGTNYQKLEARLIDRNSDKFMSIISEQLNEFSLTTEVIYGHAWGNEKPSQSELEMQKRDEETFFIDATLNETKE